MSGAAGVFKPPTGLLTRRCTRGERCASADRCERCEGGGREATEAGEEGEVRVATGSGEQRDRGMYSCERSHGRCMLSGRTGIGRQWDRDEGTGRESGRGVMEGALSSW